MEKEHPGQHVLEDFRNWFKTPSKRTATISRGEFEVLVDYLRNQDIHWQACCPKCGAEQEDLEIEDGCHPFCSDCYCKKCETEFSIDENNHIHYYKK